LVVGKLSEGDILNRLLENSGIRSQKVETIMTAPFPFVDLNSSIDRISALIDKDNSAVMVECSDGVFEIITQYDIINAISA